MGEVIEAVPPISEDRLIWLLQRDTIDAQCQEIAKKFSEATKDVLPEHISALAERLNVRADPASIAMGWIESVEKNCARIDFLYMEAAVHCLIDRFLLFTKLEACRFSQIFFSGSLLCAFPVRGLDAVIKRNALLKRSIDHLRSLGEFVTGSGARRKMERCLRAFDQNKLTLEPSSDLLRELSQSVRFCAHCSRQIGAPTRYLFDIFTMVVSEGHPPRPLAPETFTFEKFLSAHYKAFGVSTQTEIPLDGRGFQTAIFASAALEGMGYIANRVLAGGIDPAEFRVELQKLSLADSFYRALFYEVYVHPTLHDNVKNTAEYVRKHWTTRVTRDGSLVLLSVLTNLGIVDKEGNLKEMFKLGKLKSNYHDLIALLKQ